MSRITFFAISPNSTLARLVISPAMTTSPVLMSASQATRLAASASAASGPLVVTSMRLPCSAASIMTPMMLRPFTTCPSLATVTSALKRLAVCTRSAAARAWSPRRLRISRVARCSSVAAPIGVFAARDGGARRRGRPEDGLPPVAQDEARQTVGVHLPAHRAELDEDRHVDPGHHLGAGLARDRETQVGRRVAQHVRQDDRAGAAIDPAHRAGDALADRVGGVAVGRRHALQAVERTEDALENPHHLLPKASLSDYDDSDHDEMLTPAARLGQAKSAIISGRHRGGGRARGGHAPRAGGSTPRSARSSGGGRPCSRARW